MNNRFSNLSTPNLNGLIDIKADLITSSTTSTSQLFINGVDVSDEVQNNKQKIIALQQITTGITYSDTAASDLTTIDNNVKMTKYVSGD